MNEIPSLVPENRHWFRKLVSQVSTFFQVWKADGCIVMKTSVMDGWARTCCSGSSCVDIDTDVLGVQVWNER